MEPLFTISPSNTHQSLLLQEPEKWDGLLASLNQTSLSSMWVAPDFVLQTVDKRADKRPNICTAASVLAVRADLQQILFTSGSSDFELLPARVSGEDWLILNCLISVKGFDEEKSQVLRGSAAEIYLVLRLRVTDPAAYQHEAFTLTDSNHAQLFVRSSFRDRVKKSKLHGITLREIGELI